MELPHPFHCAAATRSASLLRLSKHKHTQLATEAVESMDEDGSLAASSFEVALIPGSGGSRGPPRSRQSIISHPTLTPPNFTTHFGGLAFNLQRNEPKRRAVVSNIVQLSSSSCPCPPIELGSSPSCPPLCREPGRLRTHRREGKEQHNILHINASAPRTDFQGTIKSFARVLLTIISADWIRVVLDTNVEHGTKDGGSNLETPFCK